MTLLVSWRIPSIFYLSFDRSTGFRKRREHVLAFPEVASEVRPAWKEPDFAIAITEFALESLSPMPLVVVSLQVRGARTLMTTHIATKQLLLEMDI